MQEAMRNNQGKLEWSLVDFESLEPLVEVLMFGAEKYDAHNWKKGMPVTKVCESMLRHTFAFMNGQDLDEESKLSHIGHIMCNAMFLSRFMMSMPEWDDRYINDELTHKAKQIDDKN
jgi:hypothetical protein